MEESSSNINDTKNEPVVITAAGSPPVMVDPQNPLPEPSFFWRRWIAVIICVNALVFAWFAAAWLVGGAQWDHLYSLTKLIIYFAALVLTYYFVAPSASELTNMIQSANIIKKSLTMASDAANTAAGTQRSYDQRKFEADTPADSRIPATPPGGASTAPTGEVDAAPKGRP